MARGVAAESPTLVEGKIDTAVL